MHTAQPSVAPTFFSLDKGSERSYLRPADPVTSGHPRRPRCHNTTPHRAQGAPLSEGTAMDKVQAYTVLAIGLIVGVLGSVTIGATMFSLYLVWGLIGATSSWVLVPMLAGAPQIGKPVVESAVVSALGALAMVLVGPLIA